MIVRVHPTNIIVKVGTVSTGTGTGTAVSGKTLLTKRVLLVTADVPQKFLFADYGLSDFASTDDYDVLYRGYLESAPSTSEVWLSALLKETDGVTFTSPENNTRLAWSILDVS